MTIRQRAVDVGPLIADRETSRCADQIQRPKHGEYQQTRRADPGPEKLLEERPARRSKKPHHSSPVFPLAHRHDACDETLG